MAYAFYSELRFFRQTDLFARLSFNTLRKCLVKAFFTSGLIQFLFIFRCFQSTFREVVVLEMSLVIPNATLKLLILTRIMRKIDEKYCKS